jgi:PadR family transcriptional regulator, regulatory protein PadR
MTHATALVLRALATGHTHGFDIMEVSGLPSGTVYPVLRRLERAEKVRSSWEDQSRARDAGRPRRRVYHLTAAGERVAARAADRLADAGRFLASDGGLRTAGGAEGADT